MSSGCYLGRKGYTIFKESLSNPDLDWIRRTLIARPRARGSPVQPEPFPVYIETDTRLYMPQHFGNEHFGPPDEDKLKPAVPISVEFAGSLRPNQVPIVNKYMKGVLGNRTTGGLLDVPCGYGKTACALKIISELKVKTLVIVHKSFLMDQWIERIEQFLPGTRIGRIQGQVVDTQDKDIVLGMLQSLCMKTYAKNTFDGFGLTVVDECHHIPSEVFSRAMLRIVTKYTLGLSATMTRKDGLTPVLKMFLGQVVCKVNRKSDSSVLVKMVTFTKRDSAYLEPILDYRGKELHASMITKLCTTSERTQFVHKVIMMEEGSFAGQQFLVLSQNKSLLSDLANLLKEGELTTGFYVGGMKRGDLAESENKKVILATYGMAAEGLDISGLTTIVLATPRTDITQAVGRILRTKHERPLVIDIVDVHDCFQSQVKKRKRFYQKNKYTIEEYDSRYYPAASEPEPKCLLDLGGIDLDLDLGES